MSVSELFETFDRGETQPPRRNAVEIELSDEFWRNAKLMPPLIARTPAEPKASVHLRVDPDVLRWFKGQGKGHLTRMNAVLRAYYEANRKKAS
jgi:uncharacterized protein (DUF4415 family)